MSLSNNESFVGKNITTSTGVKTSDGMCGGIFVSSGSPTITIYDSLSASGLKIVDTFTGVAGVNYALPFGFATGLYVALVGTCSITVFYT